MRSWWSKFARFNVQTSVLVSQLNPITDTICIKINEIGWLKVILWSDSDTQGGGHYYVAASCYKFSIQVVKEAFIANVKDSFKWLLLKDESILVIYIKLNLFDFLNSEFIFELVRLE